MKTARNIILTSIVTILMSLLLLPNISYAVEEGYAMEPYVVHEGDTLSSIAGALCGNAEDWQAIYTLNSSQIKNANIIYIGEYLSIPVAPENSAVITNADITSGWTQQDWDCFGKMSIKERKTYLAYLRKEPEVSILINEAVKISGGYLSGFENRCKTPHSLYEKMYLRPQKVRINEVTDIIRYTEILPEATYTKAVNDTLTHMISQGWKISSLYNAWVDTSVAYLGVNVDMISPEGLRAELQFHTEKSFEVKNSEEDHSLYERRRLLEKGSDEYNQILEQQFKLYSVVPIPVGVESISEANFTGIAADSAA